MEDSTADLLLELGFLYMAGAHATDGVLDPDEVVAIGNRLQGWAPTASLEAVDQRFVAAARKYREMPSMDDCLARITQISSQLESELDETQRVQVLSDLIAIMDADGRLLEQEKAFVLAVGKILKVEVGTS